MISVYTKGVSMRTKVGTKPWREIRKTRSKLTADEQAQIDREVKDENARIRVTLEQIRKARHQTQHQLAEQLGTNQGALSRLERQSDLYISTLRRFVEAMGGELILLARFGDGPQLEVTLSEDDVIAQPVVSAILAPRKSGKKKTARKTARRAGRR
jgi:transcriptional regulator with XRE-family HTH domain